MDLNRLDRVLLVSDSDRVWLRMFLSIRLLHSQHQSHFIIVLLCYVEIRLMSLQLLLGLMMLLSRDNLTSHEISSLIDFHCRLTVHRLSLIVLALLAFGLCGRLCMLNDTPHDHLMMMALFVWINNFVFDVDLNSWNERL